MSFLYSLGGAVVGVGRGFIDLVQQRRRGQQAPPIPVMLAPADLPLDILHMIVALSDKETKLALFGTSRQLRDAVLGRGAAGSSMPPITNLYLATNMATDAASRLLQLAVSSNHEVHLHISSASPAPASAPSDMAMLQSSNTAPDSSNSSQYSSRSARSDGSPSSNGSCKDGYSSSSTVNLNDDAAWLATLFPCDREANPALQRISTLELRDMHMDNPLPLCLGVHLRLRSYTLSNVTWPTVKRAYVWPWLQHLSLYDVSPLQMLGSFHPATLPQLTSLHVSWSKDFDEMQRSQHEGSGSGVGECFVEFRNQLRSLALEGVPWGQVMTYHLEHKFPRLLTLRTAHPLGDDLDFDLDFHMDVNLTFLDWQAPNVEQLHIGLLHFYERHRQSCGLWSHLRHVKIDAIDGDVMSTLALLPAFPALKMVSLPVNGTVEDVVVGNDWLSDVGKVMNRKPIVSAEPPEESSLGHDSCNACTKGMLDRAMSVVLSCCRSSTLVSAFLRVAKTLRDSMAGISSSLLLGAHSALTA